MAFFVTKILDVNVVMITPEWRIWKHNRGGNRVRISGYTVAKDAGTRRDAKKLLMSYLLNRKIELKNITGIRGGNLIAEVWIAGINIATKMDSVKATRTRKEEKREAKKIEEASPENNPEIAQATNE